jgi:hypothetical protein
MVHFWELNRMMIMVLKHKSNHRQNASHDWEWKFRDRLSKNEILKDGWIKHTTTYMRNASKGLINRVHIQTSKEWVSFNMYERNYQITMKINRNLGKNWIYKPCWGNNNDIVTKCKYSCVFTKRTWWE